MRVTHKISTKAISVNADIARIDELYPDKDVTYTYIGMVSFDESEPLTIYFNESIGDSTITEPWELFDTDKYKERITNFPQLTSDMQAVISTGISKVERITPTDGMSVFAKTHTAADVVEGQWAIYQGVVYVNSKYPDTHIAWFERIDLPSYGNEFDKVTRGTFALEGDVLYVARNSGAGSAEDLVDQQNRLAEKILYTINSTLRLVDLTEYKVTADNKYTDQPFTEGVTMENVQQELTEDNKLALLTKYAGNEYIRFDAGGTLRISLDKLDLLILPEIEKLKNSEGTVQTKIAAAKEIALAAATEKLADIIDIEGISISFGPLELSGEAIDWDELLTPEEGE